MPPEIQREYSEKYPKGSNARLMPVFPSDSQSRTMEYDELNGPNGVPIRVPSSDAYRTCGECGNDCEPDTSVGVDGLGVRIAFVCREHGVQSNIDPFEEQRKP